MIKYQLIRSEKRKSISLQVKNNAVIVRAPTYVTDSYIEHLVLQKTSWLEAKLQIQNSQQAFQKNNYLGVNLSNNGNIWINGDSKKIRLLFSQQPSIENTPEDFIVTLLNRYQQSDETKLHKVIKRKVELWLKQQATALIIQKVNSFSHEFNLFPQDIKVRQYKARWGSCNSRGELSFNYLLLMTPDWVIDYVVVHELCHLKYLNHSKQFWLLVEQCFPRFKEAKQWLKLHQNQLNWPRA